MLPKFFIDRPIFAWVIAILIMLAGGLAIRELPVAQYPSIAPPALAVTATYPGASAKTLEETVTSIIEQELNGVDGLLYMASNSESSGQATITVTFQTGTSLDLASVEVQNRIKRVEARLPEEVRRQGVRVDKAARNYLMFVTISSRDGRMNATDLGNYANSTLIDSIRRVPGVGEATLFGSEYAMRVWLNPTQLTAYALTPNDVVKAIREQNVQVAAGELGALPANQGQMLNATVVTDSRLTTPEQFGDILLRANPDGSTVRVKDVARVELGANSYAVTARVNGHPSAAIAVKLSPTGNALETAELVRAKMTELSRFFPAGVEYNVPYDTSAFVKISIEEVVKTLAEAVVLVFFVMYLFLQNFRATLIPTLVVPVALLGTFAGLWAFGYSINVLTLFGMVLAIGILVDDAIVVVENVERLMADEKLPAREATRKAMGQITGAIIAITLVLSAVFVPMAFFGGSVGAIYRQFSMTLVISMAFSALLALTLTPALCASLLSGVKAHGEHRGFFGWFDRWFDKTVGGYEVMVARILRRSARYLAGYLAIIVATGWLMLHLPGSFLPEEDQGYFITMIQLPAGATQERTLKVLEQVEDHYLHREKAVDQMISVAGFSFFGSGQNAAIAFVRLKDWSQRTTPDLDAKAVVGRAFMALSGIKDAIIFPLNPPSIPELGNATGFEFQLQDRAGLGHDKLLQARNLLLMKAMDKQKYPMLAGVRPEGQEDTAQLRVDIDRSHARALGVAIDDVNTTLAVALGSAYANDFTREGRVQRVIVQSDAAGRMQPQDILALRVRNASGQMVPFASFAKVEWSMGSPRLERYNGIPSMKIAGAAAPGYSSGDAMAAMEQIAAELPPGLGFEWSGQSYEERLSGSQAPALYALSLLVVFLCLAALYESWSIPVAVMMVVPLGVFGAVAATSMRGMANDVYFKVGLIAIIGLASKNAILIIEFAKELHGRGKPLLEATLEACRLRFRPILMTSLAFILGVLPLAISTGAGGASRRAIGTGVIGGMIAATVFAVFLVPVFFVLIRRIFKGKPAIKPEAAEAADI